MSTKQSKNNRQNQFIARESTHNVMSMAFYILITLVAIVLIILSSLIESVYVLVPSILFLLFSLIKIAYQVKSIYSLNKLSKTFEDDHISFYITKSWNRKKEATVWFAGIWLIIIAIPLIITLALIQQINDNLELLIFNIVVLFVSIIAIIIVAYLNLQTLEGYLKLSAKRMDLMSMEWIQIRKETKIFYRLIFVYFISTLLVLPLLLLIIPAYRNWIYKIVKN